MMIMMMMKLCNCRKFSSGSTGWEQDKKRQCGRTLSPALLHMGRFFFYNNYYDHDDYYDDRDDIHCDLNPKTLKRKKNEDDPDQLFLF